MKGLMFCLKGLITLIIGLHFSLTNNLLASDDLMGEFNQRIDTELECFKGREENLWPLDLKIMKALSVYQKKSSSRSEVGEYLKNRDHENSTQIFNKISLYGYLLAAKVTISKIKRKNLLYVSCLEELKTISDQKICPRELESVKSLMSYESTPGDLININGRLTSLNSCSRSHAITKKCSKFVSWSIYGGMSCSNPTENGFDFSLETEASRLNVIMFLVKGLYESTDWDSESQSLHQKSKPIPLQKTSLSEIQVDLIKSGLPQSHQNQYFELFQILNNEKKYKAIGSFPKNLLYSVLVDYNELSKNIDRDNAIIPYKGLTNHFMELLKKSKRTRQISSIQAGNDIIQDERKSLFEAISNRYAKKMSSLNGSRSVADRYKLLKTDNKLREIN